jgi:hypothetical protein
MSAAHELANADAEMEELRRKMEEITAKANAAKRRVEEEERKRKEEEELKRREEERRMAEKESELRRGAQQEHNDGVAAQAGPSKKRKGEHGEVCARCAKLGVECRWPQGGRSSSCGACQASHSVCVLPGEQPVARKRTKKEKEKREKEREVVVVGSESESEWGGVASVLQQEVVQVRAEVKALRKELSGVRADVTAALNRQVAQSTLMVRTLQDIAQAAFRLFDVREAELFPEEEWDPVEMPEFDEELEELRAERAEEARAELQEGTEVEE